MFKKAPYPLVVFCLIFCGQIVLAQMTTATVSGIVRDDSGAVLPGVSVAVENLETEITRTLVTDDEGRYRATNLSVGKYQVTASLEGFQTTVRSGIELTLGREAVVDLVLKVGEISERVTVTGEAPLINTTSAEVGGLVEQTQVGQLPLNSRDYSQLISLQAGVTVLRQQEGGANSGLGRRISVSGARTSANSLLLDGVNLNTETGQLPSGVTGAALGVEAIREFQVLNSNYNAQYGRAAGANIVAITRSGTNSLHGSLYWYLRNDNLDARNFFDTVKPEFKRNQFGFSLGGPIIKDKTFYFGSYEGLRDRLGRTAIARVPTADARIGILPGRTVRVDPRIVPYLDLYPLPNGIISTDGTGEFVSANRVPTNQNYVTTRFDHTFTDKYSIFARYTRESSDRNTPDDLKVFAALIDTTATSFATELKALFSPTFVGMFRLGMNRTQFGEDFSALNNKISSLSFVEGRPFGTVTVTGLSSLDGFGKTSSPSVTTLTAPQASISFDYTVGRHIVKFGVDFEKDILASYLEQLAGGSVAFGSLTDFLTNAAPRRVRLKGVVDDPFRTYDQLLFGTYIHDDFRVTPRLTVNLGLRYDFTTVPTERYGRLSNVRYVLDPGPTQGDPFYQNDIVNFDPRIGFAWDVRGDSKTSIRGGFGIFHEPLLAKQVLNVMKFVTGPFRQAISQTPGEAGLFPFISQAKLTQLVAGPQSTHAFDFDAHTPYMIHYSLSLQRSLPGDMVGTATYTRTRGVHLVSRADFDIPVPTLLPDGRVFFATAAPFWNPNFGQYKRYGTGADSWYHGLQTGIRKRLSSGLMFQLSYTFSRSLDTQSAHLSAEAPSTVNLNPFNFFQDRALADTDIRHNFVVNWVYQLPLGRDLTGIGGRLLQGWNVNGIVSLATGSPVSVGSNAALTHPLMTSNTTRPDLASGADNNPVLGGPNRYFDTNAFVRQQPGFLGTVGRNTVIAPGLAQLDLSLIKEFTLSESNRLEFRSEFFNVLNRTNFSYPDTTLFDARAGRLGSAGRITRTTTTARQIQFALRYTF